MRRALMAGMSLLIGATGSSGLFAAPPPPPAAWMDALAQRLTSTLTATSFDEYAATFADDLLVRRNGMPAASGKGAWLDAERQRLGKVDRFVLIYAEGADAILVVDRFDDRSALPTAPTMVFDPRYVTRAIRYAIGRDHLVHTLDIVEADGIPRKP